MINNYLKHLTPMQIIALVFTMVIACGSLLLSLPIASQTGEWTTGMDAFFTAVSATCVVGLTTLDVSSHWSLFGRSVILAMIELGGLGFMTVAITAFTLLKQAPSLRTRIVIKESYNLDSYKDGIGMVAKIIKIALTIQILGSICLTVAFMRQMPLNKAVGFGVFHAVSAFCNAGFDLFGDSLVGYKDQPFVLLVISVLIILGSFGFMVFMSIGRRLKGRSLGLHARLALITTGLLLLVGTCLFALINLKTYQGNLGTYLVQSFFLAVTPRTAGFFIQDYSMMTAASVFLTLILMAIGGTSGSTAGGLKTTTVAVLLLNMRSVFLRKKYTYFGKQSIASSTISQVYEIFFIYMALVLTATFVLMMTESPQVTSGGMPLVFEVVSAVSTVGLTMDVTPHLSGFGKLLVAMLMFVGRIGIFTMIFSLNSKPGQDVFYKYPEGKVMVG